MQSPASRKAVIRKNKVERLLRTSRLLKRRRPPELKARAMLSRIPAMIPTTIRA